MESIDQDSGGSDIKGATMGSIDQDLLMQALNKTVICYSQTIYRTNGVWEGPNPLSPILPIFIFQLPLAIFATRIGIFLMKPFNMPTFIGEIIGGVVIGPSFFGKIAPSTYKWFFPTYGFTVLEPMAHLGLVYYAFLVGLMMDIQTIRRTGTKAVSVAVTGAVVPCFTGAMLFLIVMNDKSKTYGCMYWGFALSVSGYSNLAAILEKQTLLHTEVGKLAIASSQVSEMISWALLTVGVAVANSKTLYLVAIVLAIIFTFVWVYAIRPALSWIISKTAQGQGYSEFYLCFILCGMALSGVVADVIGTHPMFGAFMFGLIIPNEMLQSTLVDRLGDFVMEIFMPAFFAVCGIRTNLHSLTDNNISWLPLVTLVVLFSGTKTFSMLLASSITNLTVKDSATVGLLTSTKNILALIILEIAREHGVLLTHEYTLMVLSVVIMTMLVPPLTKHYHPNNDKTPYKRKTIEKSRSVEELRVLACIHEINNVPSIINILEASNATQRSPICVFALHLVELIGRASAMLVVHNTRKAGSRHPTHEEARIEQIISAFDNYELRCDGVSVKALTSRSAYANMDEDICSVARDKRAAFIILPFHRQQTPDGEMEDINPSIRSVNENVLAHAPCSVGVLIDRRMADSSEFPRRVAVLFFGGPDDREALAYAWRMPEHPNVCLKVVKFNPGKDVLQVHPMDFMGIGQGNVSVPVDAENEKVLDDVFLNKFKIATANDKSVLYQELVLNDEEETIRAIKAMENDHDLFIVGKGRGVGSPLTAGLADWCDCPELGPIGDLFATSEFSSSFSVLVMQQYVRSDDSRGGSDKYQESFGGADLEPLDWRSSKGGGNDEFGSFKHMERELGHGSFNHKDMDHELKSFSDKDRDLSLGSFGYGERNLSR